MLRALWAADVRNVIVFIDPHELGHALADRAPAAAGRAYHVVAARHAKKAFHPKVMLLTGREGARLCVSSANLTADGQLRNAESAIAFDSAISGHVRPILQAGDLFGRLSKDVPAHTAAAVQAALAALPDDDGKDSPFRLIHNLDEALVEAFPPAEHIRAISPFVDADGTAARRLHEQGDLTVIVDGEHLAASGAFFAGPWAVDARRFDARLHGKAYELRGGDHRWILVGSPNLSEPALLQPATAGNFEVAVAVEGQHALDLPSNEPWEHEGLPDAAAARLSLIRRDREDPASSPRGFDAWEDERRIVVAGIPDGSTVDHWASERWHPLGVVVDGAVLLADPEIRPTRIRAVFADGRVAFAVVAQPAWLRARLRAPTSGKQVEAARRLPLDVDTLRVLEEALSQLYVLSALAGERPNSGGTRASKPPAPTPDLATDLLDWRPRVPGDEPRVPALYRTAWTGEPDALLALISRVLRLEDNDAPTGEVDVARENVELEDLDGITSIEQIDLAPSAKEPPPPPTTRPELDRYRRAFQRLFDRGLAFLDKAVDPTLAGWAFTYLLRLVEDLGAHQVEVDGRTEPLMPRPVLRHVTLELLEGYLGRDERDLLCLASARGHLAAALRECPRYTPLDAERLHALAFKWAAELIAVPQDVPGPAQRDIGIDAAGAVIWLQDYAERSAWTSIEQKATSQLDDTWLERSPWHTIVGQAAFANRLQSPAWDLLGFAAPAGYASMTPFAVAVHNTATSPVSAHALICVPRERLIIEVSHRSADSTWSEHRYTAPTRRSVERLAGPGSLDRIGYAEHADPADAPEPVRTLAPLLAALAETFRVSP